MSDGGSGDTAGSVERGERHGRKRAGSESHAHEQLTEQLRQLGEELIDEPIPRRLLDALCSAKPPSRH